MAITPPEFLLALTDDQQQALAYQLKCCISIREVQRTQVKLAESSTPPRTPVRVFGAPLDTISGWTHGESDGLWASVNMAMMGYPPKTLMDPKWDYQFCYRAARNGLVQNGVGDIYLPQLKHLGLLELPGVTAPVPAGMRVMALTFRTDPTTKQWFVAMHTSAKPKPLPK